VDVKEYKVLSSWTKSFDLHGDDPPRYRRFSPICLTKDNVLFGSDPRHKRLLKLCCKTNNWLEGGFTYGKGEDLHNCNLQCSLYTESLLSIPSSFNSSCYSSCIMKNEKKYIMMHNTTSTFGLI
jgi:hypothetical protein